MFLSGGSKRELCVLDHLCCWQDLDPGSCRSEVPVFLAGYLWRVILNFQRSPEFLGFLDGGRSFLPSSKTGTEDQVHLTI